MSDVFISYSRKNSTFSRRLIDRLVLAGKDAWVDWEGIPLTSPNWWAEIKAGIDGADSFLFIVSPDSMASVVCNMELDYAIELHKRIVPVVYQDVESRDAFASIADYQPDAAMGERLAGKDPLIIARSNWQHLSHINWIFFRDTDDFDAAFETLVTAVTTDLPYVKAHTRYLVRAQEWERENRRADLLLFGEEIDHAEEWLRKAEEYAALAETSAGKKVLIVNPLPRDLHRDYIRVSREEDTRRRRLLRNLRVGTLIFAAVGIIAVILAAGSLVASQEAQSRADVAATQAADAELREAGANARVTVAVAQVATATVQQGQAELNAATATRQVATAQAVQGTAVAGAQQANTQAAVAIATVTQVAALNEIVVGFANAILQQRDNPGLQIAAMDAIVQRYGDQSVAYLSRGAIYAVQGNQEAAIADYTRAIVIDPSFYTAYINRGKSYSEQGDLEAAIADYSHAIGLDRNDADAYLLRGAAYAIQRNPEAAFADISRAIEIDPNDARAFFLRGAAHAIQGNPEAAIADYSHAIELDSNYAEAYYNRGAIYAIQGNLEEAIADFSRVIEIDRSNANAYLARGDAYYQRADESNPDFHADLSRALADWRQAEALDLALPEDVQNALIFIETALGTSTPAPSQP